MGEEQSHAEVGGVPVVIILFFSGFFSFICILGCGVFYCFKKCGEQEEREKNERKENLWANAQVVQPPIVYQNQRKSYL